MNWEAYKKSHLATFAKVPNSFTLPADKLSQIYVKQLHYQPAAIVSRPIKGGDEVLIADYFGPGICRAKVTHNKKGLSFVYEWVSFVKHGTDNVRLFPWHCLPGGANHCETVNFGKGNTIWISRNGERDFFMLSPIKGIKKSEPVKMEITKKITLPPHSDTEFSVQSTLFYDSLIVTLENSTRVPENEEDWQWRCCFYNLDENSANYINGKDISPWMYGIAYKAKEYEHIWLGTDHNCIKPHGIYCDNTLVVPDVCGQGLCFLSDGSMLVAGYNVHAQLPGALIYVPADMLK